MADSSSDSSTFQRLFEAVVSPLSGVSGHRFDQAFMLLLLGVIGWQLYAAQAFSADGRLFSVVIGSTTFLLLVLLLLSQVSSTVAGLMKRFGGDVMTMGSEVGEMVSGEDEIDEQTARTRVLRISVWILIATFLIWLVGFIPSILLFMLVFYLLETNLGPARSVLYAVVIWIDILIVFVELLNTRFYSGVFDVMAFFPYP
jgi:hypothetical protein